jgi:hypothetical protein
MNTNDRTWWSNYRQSNIRYFSKEIDSMNIQNDEYRMISEIYARVKNLKVDYPCKCNPKTLIKMIDEIDIKFKSL